MPAKYIAIAEPLRAEWRPSWSAVKPRISGPIEVAASRSFLSNSVPENKWNLLLGRMNVLTVVSLVEPVYEDMRRTILVHIFTGQRVWSDDLN